MSLKSGLQRLHCW